MTGREHPPVYAVSIRLARRQDLEAELDRAVDAAIEAASSHPGLGIRVSRHDHQNLTVELTGEVPHGTIAEFDLRTGRL
jgi:hypothetical protein